MNKQELLLRVRKYVTHAKKVHESSRARFKTHMEYARMMESLQFVKTGLADLGEYNSKYQIARRIYGIRRQLREILPNMMNDSYNNSFNELETILNECFTEINTVRVQL